MLLHFLVKSFRLHPSSPSLLRRKTLPQVSKGIDALRDACAKGTLRIVATNAPHKNGVNCVKENKLPKAEKEEGTGDLNFYIWKIEVMIGGGSKDGRNG